MRKAPPFGWEDFARFYAEAAYKIEKRKRINLLKPNSIMDMLMDNFRAPRGPVINDEYVAASDTDRFSVSNVKGYSCVFP